MRCILLLVLLFSTCFCLTCYNLDSNKKSSKPSDKTICPLYTLHCIKQVSSKSVVFSCDKDNLCKNVNSGESTKVGKTTVYCCGTSLCNTAITYGGYGMPLWIAIILLLK